MANTQAARAAAQLHQAALDVAGVAARRSAEAEEQVTDLHVQDQIELAEDRDNAAVARGDPTVPTDG